MDKAEILKVLDMSEDEQLKWLIEKGVTDGGLAISQVTNKIVTHWIRIEFADLAERLWKEAMHYTGLYTAMLDVHQKVEGPQDRSQDYVFWAMRAKSIHKIIAALKAKGESNG